MTNPPQLSPEQAKVTGMIRMSFVIGVLLLGAVTYFIHRQPGYVAPGDNPPLRLALGAMMLVAAGIIFFARMKLGTVTTLGELQTFSLIGWAGGEMAALAGGVYYLMTDNPSLYVVGLFVMIASLIIIPLRR